MNIKNLFLNSVFSCEDVKCILIFWPWTDRFIWNKYRLTSAQDYLHSSSTDLFRTDSIQIMRHSFCLLLQPLQPSFLLKKDCSIWCEILVIVICECKKEYVYVWGTSSAEIDGHGPLPGELQALSRDKVIYSHVFYVLTGDPGPFLCWRDCWVACNAHITGPITDIEC